MAKLEIRWYGNKAVPLKAHEQTVMVKVTAPVTQKKFTSGLDIVLVLDTSGSMNGDKLTKMKKAMLLVIKNLGCGDRLAIVPFASEADRRNAKLEHATKGVKDKLQKFVFSLQAHGNTNIKAGLQVGVDLLRRRMVGKDGRTGVVFLMSDGVQTHGDAGDVDVSKFNVQTFGFGAMHGAKVLHAVAEKSHGGNYHYVQDKEDYNHLAVAFSLALGIFRSISVLNLKVTFMKQGPAIRKVDPGSYPMKHDGGSFTVDFGDVAREEARRIIVVLRFPVAAQQEITKNALTVKCSCRIVGQTKDIITNHAVYIERTRTADPSNMKPQVMIEQVRRDVAASIRKTRNLAEKGDFEGATNNLRHRLNALGGITDPNSKVVADFLTRQLKGLLRLMESKDLYDRHGNAYALASISSHDRQRPTARGHVDDLMLFTTKRVNKYIAHARPNPNNYSLRSKI